MQTSKVQTAGGPLGFSCVFCCQAAGNWTLETRGRQHLGTAGSGWHTWHRAPAGRQPLTRGWSAPGRELALAASHLQALGSQPPLTGGVPVFSMYQTATKKEGEKKERRRTRKNVGKTVRLHSAVPRTKGRQTKAAHFRHDKVPWR